MDNETEVLEKEEVVDDGTQDETLETADQDGHEQGGDADKDGGRKVGDAEGDGEKTGDEDKSAELETPDPIEERFAKLEEENRLLKEQMAKPKEEAVKTREYTDAEKEQISARFGGAAFDTVNAFTQLVTNGLQMLEQKFMGEMSVFKKDAAVMNLAKEKEFADIQSYMPGVNEFLKKFPAQHHSNAEVLKDAYWFAKGKGLKTTVKKIVASQEKNRKVASSLKVSGSKGGDKGGKSFKLTPSERAAYESFGKGTFDSEEEYARSLPRNRAAA